VLGAATLSLGIALGRVSVVGAAPLPCGVPPREPLPFPLPDSAAVWNAPAGATPTSIEWTGAGFEYRVAGQPAVVRGMGYNPPIGGLPLDARRQRIKSDLSLMAASGVNTVIGWNPAVFDGLLLDVAHRHGLGVALPFDVDFTLDVREAATRRELTSTVLRWVEQYRAHPAVRLWAVGNEVLQRSVPPAWCSQPPSDSQSDWADAWSTLLVDVADQIHAADPDHPILYREAEDAYAPWLARALSARPAPRPWLVYGVNAYTPRLAEILDGWPDRQIPTSLLVSEFAPLNAPRGERAAQFREIWRTIRARSARVLGGAVYVWSTDGPEEVDRAFGLVDPSGEAVDDTLETIAALYRGDTVATTGHENGARADAMSSGRRPVAVPAAASGAAAASGGHARADGAPADGRAGVGSVLS
jgi:hypothetical protein